MSLPTEILDLIAQSLSYGDLANLTETCQSFRPRTFNKLDPERKKYKSITTTRAGEGDVPFVEFLTEALRSGIGEMTRCLTVVSPFIRYMAGKRRVDDKGYDDLKIQLYGDKSASDGPLPHVRELCEVIPEIDSSVSVPIPIKRTLQKRSVDI